MNDEEFRLLGRITEADVASVANPERFERFRGGPPVWLVAAAGTALAAAVFYPGYLNGDSSWQYRQGLTVPYNDMHPVIMSWIWTHLDRVIEGSGGLFLLTTGLFWTGLAMFSRAFSRNPRRFLAVTFLVGLSPPVFSMLSQIHKDVGMVTGLLLGYVLLVRSDRSRALWPLLLALPALWYAVAVRHNGAAAVVPLTIWMSSLLARDHLPEGTRRFLVSPLRKLLLGTAIGVAMIWTSTMVTRAILGEEGVHVPYQKFLAAYDILGISVRAGHNYLPSNIDRDPPLRLEELQAIYDPHTAYFAFWGGPGQRRLAIQGGVDLLPPLTRSWREAIGSQPWSYAQHRIVLFLAHLGIRPNTPFRKLDFLGPDDPRASRYSYTGPNVFGTPQNRWIVGFYQKAGGSTYASSVGEFWARETGMMFRPWLYLLLSLLCLLVACFTHSAQRFPIVLLGASSFLYVLPYLAIGVSSELRYMWWPILVSLLQSSLLLDGIGRAGPSTAGTSPNIREV